MLARFKEEEKRKLCVQIEEWNASRLDMFTLSQPDENLEFFGVMRFFFQEDACKVSTKCVRVASTASCYDVIGALIEKFRPDLKMLSDHDYALYEVHEGEERKMIAGERPLLVQLNWTADDREGRFMLRELSSNQLSKRLSSSTGDLREEGMERKLSRRQRRQLKKQRRQEQKLQEQQKGQEPPEISSFMRSLSNPELVLRRRRQVKLEKKLNHINSSQNGGTLKIFGHSLKPDVPYKTLLLSSEDKVEEVVVEALDKYGLENEEANKFCLVQVMIAGSAEEGDGGVEERVMGDDECPLAILLQHPESLGTMKFHLRLRPANAPKKKNKPQLNTSSNYINNYNPSVNQRESQINKNPFLMPIRADGSDRSEQLRCFIGLGRTGVGSENTPAGKQFYQLLSPDVFPEHCDVVRDGDGRVWVEGRMGEVVVDGKRCSYPTPLNHGSILQIGNSHIFRFIDPPINNNNNENDNNNYLKNNKSVHNTSYNNNTFPNNTSNNFHNENKYSNNNNLPKNNFSNTKMLHHSPSNSSICTKDLETTFDLEGHVITAPTNLLNHLPPSIHPPNHPSNLASLNHHSLNNQSIDTNNLQNAMDKLPAMFFVNEQGEDIWLDECTHRLNFASLHLKVAPSFLFYLATRSRLTHPPATQQLSLKIASRVSALVQDNPSNPPLLSFWLANCSELLNFYHSDYTLCKPTQPASATLLQVVQEAFGSFLECLQVEMELTLPSFVNPLPDTTHFEEDFLGRRLSPTLANLLHVLTLAMSVLRRCRVNAGITIQIFSQLFKFANAWLFNCILLDSHIGLCSREWGGVVKGRVAEVVAWAERQGLELAAQCHFAKSIQLCQLLESPKSNLSNIPSTYPLLNPLQVYTALQHFQPPISPSISHLPSPDGELEESLEACPTLILPEDGFCCDSIQGLPQAFVAFAEAFEQAGLGRLVISSEATGAWNVYMNDEEGRGQLSPVPITLRKINKSLGVSIVSAKSSEQMERGIYVKSVVQGGAAQLDGRLEPGDQLLAVGDRSLVGVSQEKAAEMMAGTGEVVDLVVLKQGALFQNLPSLMPQQQSLSSQLSFTTHSSLQQNPYQKLPVQQPNMQQPPIQQPPTQQLPIQQLPTQQLPIKQPPIQQLPIQQKLPLQQPSHGNPMMTQQLAFQQRNSQQPLYQQPPHQQLPSQQQRSQLQQSEFQATMQAAQQFKENIQNHQPQQPTLQMSEQPPHQLSQQPIYQPHFRDSSQIRIETDSFQSTNILPSQPSHSQNFPNQPVQNPSGQYPIQISTQSLSQPSSSLLTNLKLTRPLSSLSSKKPGYASQVLFPKNQPTSNNSNTDNKINTSNNDINNNSLKTNLNFNNKINLPDNSMIPQQKSIDPNYSTKTPVYMSPPLPPLANHSPSPQAATNQQTYDFPSPPMNIQMAKMKIDLENNPNILANPSSIQPSFPPTYQPTIAPTKPPPVAVKPKISKSPWEREAVEKEQEEERKGRQVQEMLHLQMKENRSYDEEQRLRRLQTEEEFDRRAMQEQLSSQSMAQLKPPSTPGTMKKSVTFSENVGVNEYHRSFSSTSSDPPPSPSVHSTPLSLHQSLNPIPHSAYPSIPSQAIFPSNQTPANPSTQPYTYLPNPHPNLSNHPTNPLDIQQPNQHLKQEPIYSSNQIPTPQFNTNQVNQPPTNPSNYSTHSSNYQSAINSQTTDHLFNNSDYQSFVPQNVIKESTTESQQRDFVRMAKIDQGPLSETPINYQIKPRITQQAYQKTQQYTTQPSYNPQQPIHNNQQQMHIYQQQPIYQQQNYYSQQQQEPTFQQQPSQPSYLQKPLERDHQPSLNSNQSTYLYRPLSQPQQPPYTGQRNQNYTDYKYE